MKSNFTLLLFLLLAFLCGCSDDSVDGQSELILNDEILLDADNNYLEKKDFAKSLAKVLSDNLEVRELIKNEALKKNEL